MYVFSSPPFTPSDPHSPLIAHSPPTLIAPRSPLITSPDPHILPHVRVDRGAIRFLLSGAHMMCPGFTSKGGSLPPSPGLPAGVAVAIHAEGKESALGVGLMKLGTEDIKKINKGVGVEVACYVGDDLWAVEKI